MSLALVKRFGRDKGLVAIAVLLVCGFLVLYSHSSPSVLNHEVHLQQILANINRDKLAASSEPVDYIRSEIETDYAKQLFGVINENLHLREKLAADYADKNSQGLVKYITGKISQAYASKFSEEGAETQEVVDEVLEKNYNKKNYLDDIIERVILHNAPKTSSMPRGSHIYGYSYNNVWAPYFSRKFLTEGRAQVDETRFHDLQSNHDNLVKVLRELPEPPVHLVHGDGIVISGGSSYFLGALTVIGQIREMGSVLPIELVLGYESEYDEYICEKLLPKLGGKCLIIEREIGSSLLKKLDLKRFQLKILALLVSSFDNTIALDADNFPIQNVDNLLKTEVYAQSKFILWPDIWHKGTSPAYYDIARFKIGEPVRRQGLPNDHKFSDYVARDKNTEILFHDLEGTPPAMGAETGQMVFSKKSHFRSFLLALYYNVYGYSHYYELLFQGVFGEGDRETFIPALHVMNEPYYLVRRECWLAGHKNAQDNFLETTLVQYNPQESQDFFDDWEAWLKTQKLDTRLWPYQANDYTRDLVKKYENDPNKKSKRPGVIFLHIHRPKINAIANTLPHNDGLDDIYTRRNLGLPGVYRKDFGDTDWELKFHSISKWLACDALKSKKFWRDMAALPQKEVCTAVTNYVEFLKKDSPDVEDGRLPVIEKLEV